MTTQHLAYDLLGPVFFRFCHDLRIQQQTYRDRRPTALYMTRGGTRLKYLYEKYLAGQGLAPPCPQENFYASRMAIAGGCLLSDFERVAALILNEFPDAKLTDVLSAVLPAETVQQFQSLDKLRRLADAKASEELFEKVVFANLPGPNPVHDYYRDQEALLDQYIDEKVRADRFRTALVVDTGWSGSSQAMLMRRFPDIDWQGHYFGRYNYGASYPLEFGSIIGLICEDRATVKRPMSAIFLHRHLVEGPCEARAPSVGGYAASDDGKIVPIGGAFDPGAAQPDQTEHVFAQIEAYICDQPPGQRPSEIVAAANAAGRRLWRTVLAPSRREVEALDIAPRSADFGKPVSVPVVRFDTEGAGLRQRLRNVARSLWPQGQIAVEFPMIRIVLQIGFNMLLRKERALPARILRRLYVKLIR